MRVKIIAGKYKGETGIIIDETEYEGNNRRCKYGMYCINLDNEAFVETGKVWTDKREVEKIE